MFVLSVVGLLACAAPDPDAAEPGAPASPEAGAGGERVEPLPPTPRGSGGVLSGPCEASALAPWGDGWLVADNEDSARLYAFDAGFEPRPAWPLAEDVGDIEALAVQGDGLWVVGSQSTTADGEVKEKRRRILGPDGELVPLDLSVCAPCARMYGVAADLGGLNVEGAAWIGDRLVLGLRSPLSDAGDALLLVTAPDGRVEAVHELDLDGAGVRALVPSWEEGGLLIVAGPSTQGDDRHTVWRLDTLDGAATRVDLTLPASAEGAALLPGAPRTLVYVTDGAGTPEACGTAATWGRVGLPM